MPLDEAENVLADIIRRFQREREEEKRERQQERAASELARQEHYDRMTAIVESLRKDIFASLAPMQLDQIEHERIHEDDKKERYMKQEENSRRFDGLQRDIRDVRLFLVVGFFLFLGGVIGVVLLR